MRLRERVEPNIVELIDQKRWKEVQDSIAKCPTPEVADLLLSLEKSERVWLFRLMPRQLSSAVFSYLDPQLQNSLLKELTDDETRRLLANLEPDDRTHLLEELPGQAIQRLLNLLSGEDLKQARQLLGYPAESVGRLMTPEYLAVRPDWTIEKALQHIRTRGGDSETLNIIYVTDESWRLRDALELRRFVLAAPSDTVNQLMGRRLITLSAHDDREEAVQAMLKYDLFAVPVVDSDGVLLGVVTMDDVLDVAEEETTEDFQKVAAVTPLKVSYRHASVWSLYRKRIPWLVALVLVNLATSGVIAAYEQTLASAIALAFFIPLLLGSGGNAGVQAATLTVRALATGDVKKTQWLRTLGKEVLVGGMLGITMGLAALTLGLFRVGFETAAVLALAMVAIVIAANIMGVLMPFLLSQFDIDPAVASSPLITTVADVGGLLIYFSIATWILGLSKLTPN